jgi:hypothetical protein
MTYIEEIEWDKDTFEGFDWVDDYTEEGNIKGHTRRKGVMVEYTAIASRNGDEYTIQEETIDAENMTAITREEEV